MAVTTCAGANGLLKERYSMHSDAAANYRLNTVLIRALLHYHHGRTPGVGG